MEGGQGEARRGPVGEKKGDMYYFQQYLIEKCFRSKVFCLFFISRNENPEIKSSRVS